MVKIWELALKTDRRLSCFVTSEAAREFEIQLLVFPAVVVLLAALSMVFGGRCALWQWWASIVIAGVVGFRHAGNRKSFGVGMLLLLLMIFVLWIAAGITIVPLGDDYLRYHLPGIRLLSDGWNPVWEGRWDVITTKFGIEELETKPHFMLAAAKGAWYFDAVAYLFVQNPFNLTWASYFILFAASTMTVLRSFPGVSIYVKLGMILAMIGIVPTCGNSIDAIVGFAGIGLLIAMHKYIAYNEWDWPALLCYSFWMCASKQTAMLHCFVFWTLFSAVVIIRSRWNGCRKLLMVAVVMSGVSALVGASPYYSSFREFGHPLYPKCTVDQDKFPVHDMVTCDFLARNEDAAAMGRLGAYVRAYISAVIGDAYYKWKLNKDYFSPDGVTWHFQLGYPTWQFRASFCVALLCLLVLGRKEDRAIVGMVIAGTMAMPTEMIGYARYCPWMMSLAIFMLPVLCRDGAFKKIRLCIAAAVIAKYSVPTAICLPGDSGCKVAYGYSGMKYLENSAPSYIYNGYNEESYERGQKYFEMFFSEKDVVKTGVDVNKTSLGNLKLLSRQSRHLLKCEIVDLSFDGDAAAKFKNSNGRWHSFYDCSFKVAPENEMPKLQSSIATLFCSFPEMVFRRIVGRFNWT